jgi:Spx/MgsR family transcriptional regulator
VNITIYGISNCDTMRKARAWLDAEGIAYVFHDYRKEGIGKNRLEAWSETVGWELLLNRAGTTFRALSDGEKAGIDRRKALRLMVVHPTLIKRPVLDIEGRIVVGFKPEIYREVFKRS